MIGIETQFVVILVWPFYTGFTVFPGSCFRIGCLGLDSDKVNQLFFKPNVQIFSVFIYLGNYQTIQAVFEL